MFALACSGETMTTPTDGAMPSGDASAPAGDGGVAPGEDGGTRPQQDGGTTPADDGGTAPGSDGGIPSTVDGGPPLASPGCGMATDLRSGGVQLSRMFSEDANGERSFYLSLPAGYDPSRPHKVIIAYSGTNWVGEMIVPYFRFDQADDEIIVYPDPQWHDFPGWGNLGGWLLGPHAEPANGMEDVNFTAELLDYLEGNFCVDTNRVFATGHSWGGDMAAVVACFLADRITASAPAAANEPYWFHMFRGRVPITCPGKTHVWTFFGQNETHFTWQSRPGEFGDAQNVFWRNAHGCAETAEIPLDVGGGECVEFEGCDHQTRYCFYDPSVGHQIPRYFTAAITDWFRSF